MLSSHALHCERACIGLCIRVCVCVIVCASVYVRAYVYLRLTLSRVRVSAPDHFGLYVSAVKVGSEPRFSL